MNQPSDILNLPSIEVTAFGVAPYRVNFQEFVDQEVQDFHAAIQQAEEILNDKEADNGQEEHYAYREYAIYDEQVLRDQIKHVKENS